MHSAMVLSGSDDGDGPQALHALMLRHAPPENEVGVTLGGARVLARTADVALVLAAVRVYTVGLEIELAVQLRTARSGPAAHHDLWESVQRTWVGLELADGSRVVTPGRVRDARPAALDAGPEYQLTESGGGGGGRSFRQTYWLTPAAPAGDVLVVVANPTLGLDEARHVLPATELAAAGAACVELWPWEPDPVEHVDAVPAPEVPAGGWFAQTLG